MPKQSKHISIRMISVLLFLTAVVVLVSTIAAGKHYADRYDSKQETYEASVLCRQSARDIQLASDLLTRKAHGFAVTGNSDDAMEYLTELTVTKRRDIAEENVRTYSDSEEEKTLVTEAKENSDYLVGTELYSMRLTCEAFGIDAAGLSSLVSDVQLSASDSALSAEEKRLRAVAILFDDDYRTHKDTIDNSLTAALDLIRTRVSDDRDAVNDAFSSLRHFQVFMSIGLALLILLLLFWLSGLIISPLQKYVASIQRGEKITPRGVAELQTLAERYNRSFEQNESQHKKLNDQASTDALTGVNNRLVFERCCTQRMLGIQKAFLLIDIDYFKHVNDQYGHDVGDRILQKVARVLTENVRGADIVCRIGGDEFVVIMQHIRPDRSIQIDAKIDRITSMLQNTDDGLPAITLSIGIAFGDGDCPVGHLHKNADLALYEVKENGRNGHRFYADGRASNGSDVDEFSGPLNDDDDDGELLPLPGEEGAAEDTAPEIDVPIETEDTAEAEDTEETESKEEAED